jgi:hypothetical protein
MKKTSWLSAFLLCIGLAPTQAQSLQKTKWKSLFAAPINDTATFTFKRDTANITNSKGMEFVYCIFHVSHDTLTIKDIGGQIACTDEVGLYTFAITGKVLKLMVITDPCDGRANSLNGREWVRTRK